MSQYKLNQKHYDYINSVKDELVEAEETVYRIKHSIKWKRAYDYFGLLANRGILETRPTKENHYQIKLSEQVKLSDLKEIVTEEQMERIKELL